MIREAANPTLSATDPVKFAQATLVLSEYLRSLGNYELAHYLEKLLAQKERSAACNQYRSSNSKQAEDVFSEGSPYLPRKKAQSI